VALANSLDSQWRNHAEFITGRDQIFPFLTRKWAREHKYRLIKGLWAFGSNRIAVRFVYEYRDDSGNWYRAYGNENWEFGEDGLKNRRLACINEHPITEPERRFHWPLVRRPDDHPSLSDFERREVAERRSPSYRPVARPCAAGWWKVVNGGQFWKIRRARARRGERTGRVAGRAGAHSRTDARYRHHPGCQ
jgi:nuclear transport factor 2 (NTF2) superfamily protein